MSESEEEVGIRSPFGGGVASDDRELAIDEGVPESSVVPNLQFVPDSNVVIRAGEECVRRALEEVGASDSRSEEASEGDSFFDIMGSLDKEFGGESEGFTFADFLRRAGPLSETTRGRGRCSWFAIVLVIILHFPLVFLLRSNMLAIHILHKLAYGARIFMKMTS